MSLVKLIFIYNLVKGPSGGINSPSSLESHIEISGGVEHNSHIGNSNHSQNVDLSIQIGDNNRKIE